MNRKMGLLLRCVGLLAVLWFGPASAAYWGQRFRREDGICISCAGEACKDPKTTSDCKALVTGTESPEKELSEKLPDVFGKDNTAPDKLVNCYTVTFKIGDKTGEIRDCGPDKSCDALKTKAEGELKLVTDVTCSECKKGATACNSGSGTGQDSSPSPGPQASESAGPGGPEATSEGTTTAAGGGKEKSGASTVYMLSNPVYLMWVTSAVLLLRLE